MVGTKQQPVDWFPLQELSPSLENTRLSLETLPNVSERAKTHQSLREHTWLLKRARQYLQGQERLSSYSRTKVAVAGSHCLMDGYETSFCQYKLLSRRDPMCNSIFKTLILTKTLILVASTAAFVLTESFHVSL